MQPTGIREGTQWAQLPFLRVPTSRFQKTLIASKLQCVVLLCNTSYVVGHWNVRYGARMCDAHRHDRSADNACMTLIGSCQQHKQYLPRKTTAQMQSTRNGRSAKFLFFRASITSCFQKIVVLLLSAADACAMFIFCSYLRTLERTVQCDAHGQHAHDKRCVAKTTPRRRQGSARHQELCLRYKLATLRIQSSLGMFSIHDGSWPGMREVQVSLDRGFRKKYHSN